MDCQLSSVQFLHRRGQHRGHLEFYGDYQANQLGEFRNGDRWHCFVSTVGNYRK